VGNVSVSYPVLLGYDSNFSSPDSLFASGSPYHGPASYCAQAAPPVPQVVSLGQFATNLVTTFDPTSRIAKTKISAIKPTYFGALLDTIAPTVKLTATIVSVSSSTATIKLSVVASDNRAVTKVTIERMIGFSLTPLQVITTPIAQFVAAPYEWQSGTLPLADVYGKAFVACAFDAANNKTCDLVVPQIGAPTLAGFTATPATLPYGGGSTTLSWSATDAATLDIDNNVGDVLGQITQTVNVTTTTTFALTATNANGPTVATTTVTVLPPPAPAISSFTATPSSLPVGGGSVTLNWATTNATSFLLDNVAVTGTSQVVNVVASKTFVLQATGAGGSISKSVDVVVAATNDRFVDPIAGSDVNNCAQATPCKTIAKAMTGAPNAATVYLADGTYPTATVSIPDGVALQATHPGAANLVFVTLTAIGSARLTGVVFDQQGGSCSNITATSSTGTPVLTLTGVLFKCSGNAVNLGGKVKALMTPGLLAGGVYTAALTGTWGLINLNDTAELLIQGGIIDGNNAGQGQYGPHFMNTNGSSKLTLDAVTVRNRTEPVFAITNSSTVVLQNGSLLDHVGDTGLCPSSAAIIVTQQGKLTMTQSQLSNVPNAGICVQSDGSANLPTITLTQSTITNTTAAIASNTGVSADANIIASGTSLINNARGFYWFGSGLSTFDLSNMTITGNSDVGARIEGGSVKMRNSTATGNGASGGVLLNVTTADLGTTASPGGNTFSGNVGAAVRSIAAAGTTVNAVGNTWEASTPATTGVPATDAQGKYPSGTTVTGPKTHGKNFQLDNASVLNL